VTGLGEFSHIGRLYSLGSFLKMGLNFCGYFFQSKNNVSNLKKNDLGYTFGAFFKKSSGHHPACRSGAQVGSAL
jgi:hypothetical protein